MTETFRDILSTIDYGLVDGNLKYKGIDRLEQVRDYILKNNHDKNSIWHITDHINTMIENLFHESDGKLKEDCVELRRLLLHWYDDKYAYINKDQSDNEEDQSDNEEKYKNILPMFRLNSSK